jgi:hypothetical protein
MKNNQDGGILLDVIVALGICLMISTLIMKAQIKAKLMDDRVFAKSTADYQVESFTQQLARFTTHQMQQLCSNPLSLGTSVSLAGSQGTISDLAAFAAQVDSMRPVQTRCQKPFQSATGRFHFCVNLPASNGLPEQAFLGAPLNAVEVAVRLVDRWQRPIDCQRYLNSASQADVGVQIYYRQYWKSGNRAHTLNQKSGFYYAAY